jgi:putative transposase
VIDEFTHECLAIRVDRKLKAIDVIDVLSDLFILRGVPGHIRSDNGPEFVAKAVQRWITAVGAKTAYIERGSPWENGLAVGERARRGRTGMWSPLTRGCGTSCGMARSSTHCRRPKL